MLDAVTKTLDKMADGGMYDHIGGGFHRYSVDNRWLVPHFEKMLYDNGQLASTYLDAWQVTTNPRYAAVAADILDYVSREMVDPTGAFWSATDADSEGVEGKFFVWRLEELKTILGDHLAPIAAAWWESPRLEILSTPTSCIHGRPKHRWLRAQVCRSAIWI